jgi:enoyl-CoA hydratase/carnithine racemase
MASDLRLGTSRSKVAFLFVRVGPRRAPTWGACNILPRIIGAGRAASFSTPAAAMSGDEAERWGFFNRLGRPSR